MIFIICSDFLTMVGGVALNGAFLGGRALALPCKRRASRSARARSCSGQVPRTAGAPCAISLKCDFGARDVWGNAACFTPAC